MTTPSLPLTEDDFRGFTGSDEYYRHTLARSVAYTQGAQYLAERAEAYWLLDKIATNAQFNPTVRAEEFQVWVLTRDAEGNAATLRCEDGNDNVVHRERIEFTDFPLSEFTLWCEATGESDIRWVILLPSEH